MGKRLPEHLQRVMFSIGMLHYPKAAVATESLCYMSCQLSSIHPFKNGGQSLEDLLMIKLRG